MFDVQCTDVFHVYESAGGKVAALEGAALAVKRGELCVLVGPSGCGKSTLLRILLGLTTPSRGSVYLDNERKAGGVAYVPQTASLLPWRTALQNAALGLEVRKALSPDLKEFLVSQFRKYHLQGFEDAHWTSLSGGMKQKVALICALAGKPKLLFCDEPFSAIDFVSRLGLLNTFKEECRLLGVTTVFVTHNIEEAIFLGDQINIFSPGPGHIVKVFRPSLPQDAHSSVKVRETAEFREMFRDIWQALNQGSL
jgi:NitT/TauT family transport system ATP-binding protein